MKKLFVLLCLILIICFCACSNQSEQSETSNNESQTQTIRYDCYEYDIESQQFTNNILISITLTNDFEATDQSVLLTQDDKFYIGEFKRTNENGDIDKTISFFELNSDFNITENCSKVSDNWYIDNKSMQDENAYIRLFYSQINNYVVGMSIVNINKEPLSIDNALQNLSFVIGEDCISPELIEEQSVIVEGSLNTPAKQGEWISTMLYNPVIDEYEPVCISITKVETGELADRVVNDYNNLLDTSADINKSELLNPNECNWAVYRYSVFFPSSFTANENGFIENINVPITFCNIKDDGRGINGYLDLQDTKIDISSEMQNVKPGTIWTGGIGFYEIPINANYLLKINIGSSENIKYFIP